MANLREMHHHSFPGNPRHVIHHNPESAGVALWIDSPMKSLQGRFKIFSSDSRVISKYFEATLESLKYGCSWKCYTGSVDTWNINLVIEVSS